MQHKFSHISRLLLLAILLATNMAITAGFRIVQVQPVRRGDTLNVQVTVKQPLEDPFRRSLLAGLPILWHIRTWLSDGQNSTVFHREMPLQLNYDVWEETFSAHLDNQPEQPFGTLPELLQWLHTLELPTNLSVGELHPSDTYIWHLEISGLILTGEQSKALHWWMQGGNPVEEELPSRERSTGFRLNLNQFIQMFLKKEKTEPVFRQSATSSPFRLNQLPEHP